MVTLALETVFGTSCALFDGVHCLGFLEESGARIGAKRILPMIDALLTDAGLCKMDLSALAINGGPGAFSGIRIGAAVAMGLGTGLSIGVHTIGSLHALVYANRITFDEKMRILAVLDARMGEVYAQSFIIEDNLPTALTTAHLLPYGTPVLDVDALVGNGAWQLVHSLEAYNALPNARDIGALAWQYPAQMGVLDLDYVRGQGAWRTLEQQG